MITIEAISKLLDEKLLPLYGRLDAVEGRLDAMEGRLDAMEGRLTLIEARQINSTRSREEPLVKVPFPDGTLPPDADYPNSLAHLLVAGNEKLPNGQRNGWDMKKSKYLLKKYNATGALSDSDGGEDEHSQRSRNRRLTLARLLGVTAAQLNFAQLTL